MPVNQSDDFVVTLRQPDGRNRGNALETRKAGHPARMREAEKMRKTMEVAFLGKSMRLNLTHQFLIGRAGNY